MLKSLAIFLILFLGIAGKTIAAPAPDNLEAERCLTGEGDNDRFPIKTITVIGNTILKKEIEEIIKPFQNRQVSLEELLCLRTAITRLYVDRGYTTSGAFLPNNQDISTGNVTIQVVEGEVETIEVSGNARLQSGYITSRVRSGVDKPLNQNRLQEALEVLQLNPLLNRINAELVPGTEAGKSILQLKVEEAPAFNLEFGYDNYRPPSIGSDEGTIFIAHDNLTGLGDRLSGQYWLTSGLNLYDVSYEIPFNPLDGTFKIRYYNSNNVITESFLQQFDIRNQSENLSFGIRQPVYKTPSTEVALGLNLDLRRSRSTLEDRNFCFSDPCRDGSTKLTVLRFSQEWLNRSPVDVIGVSSQFSFGLGAFDATVSDFEPNSDFFSWLGQFQYVRQINSHALLLFRLNAQVTPDSLPIIEQFSLGGIDTVRGYIQNQLVTDNGVFASLEFRFALTADPGVFQIAPFFEVGTGWNNLFPDPEPSTLASVGMGLRWEIIEGLTARVDYGIPLIPFQKRGNSLQENGLYFSLRYRAF